MSNYKRKKPRRYVKCNLCTDNRNGNNFHSLHVNTKKQIESAKEQIKDL